MLLVKVQGSLGHIYREANCSADILAAFGVQEVGFRLFNRSSMVPKLSGTVRLDKLQLLAWRFTVH